MSGVTGLLRAGRSRQVRSGRRRRQSGYTLIELMVVLTLVASIAAFAIPAGRSVLPGVALKVEAEALLSDARLARREAMAGLREGWLEFDLMNRRYRRAGGPWTALSDGTAMTLATARREASGAHARIRFYPDGASTGGAVRLTAGGREMELRVDWLTGGARITEGRS